MKKILLVEDDPSLGSTLFERLSKEYEITWRKNMTDAWSTFSSQNDFDLAILDVGLPDGNGFELAKKMKTLTDLPILFLTAQSDAESRLQGFELGAEEFIPKPFHLKELLLRLKHVLEQHVPVKAYPIKDGVIHFTDMSIKLQNGKIEYPSLSDMKILKLLIESYPRQLTRDEIIDAIWGLDKMISHRTIDNSVVRLRQVLMDSGDTYIRSVRGVGYQWAYHHKEETI